MQPTKPIQRVEETKKVYPVVAKEETKRVYLVVPPAPPKTDRKTPSKLAKLQQAYSKRVETMKQNDIVLRKPEGVIVKWDDRFCGIYLTYGTLVHVAGAGEAHYSTEGKIRITKDFKSKSLALFAKHGVINVDLAYRILKAHSLIFSEKLIIGNDWSKLFVNFFLCIPKQVYMTEFLTRVYFTIVPGFSYEMTLEQYQNYIAAYAAECPTPLDIYEVQYMKKIVMMFENREIADTDPEETP